MEFTIGRNALENTKLIQESEPLDVWFHIDGYPSAHLIMKNPEKLTLKQLRKEGIIYKMALHLKKKNHKKANNINIIYTYIRNVSCTTIPGLVNTTSLAYITA